MKMPVPLLGLALLFWGWQTGLWMVAIPLALILEGRVWIRWRWDLSTIDFRRIFNLCGILFFVLLIYLWAVNRSLSVIFDLIRGLPCNFFPLVIAQTYSANSYTNLRTLFSRQGDSKENPNRRNILDLHGPYFALCLLSASAANTEGSGFYLGMVALVAGMLWSLRPKKSSSVLWLCLIMLAVNAGFIGQIGLHQLHAKLEQQAVPWLSGFDGQAVNPYQTTTRIGTIGDLKQSKTIVFRVATHNRQNFPLLLREATYNKYQASAWVAVKSQFSPVQPSPESTTWRFGEDLEDSSTITVSAQLDRGQGLLRLPDGTSSVHQLPLEEMTRNQYGAVKVKGKSDAIAYRIQFNPAQSFDSLPAEADLQIPDAEQPIITQTLQQFHLKEQSPTQTLQKVSSFFEQNFQYSLTLAKTTRTTTPLTEFLAKTHSGHCEYFASATTLLLRAAGIPARYATGYAVHEWSPLEHQYLGRSRDAHAWTMAYINGGWQSFDTTPPNWSNQVDSATSPIQGIADLWSFLTFKLSTTLQTLGKGSSLSWLEWIVAPFLGFALWYLGRKRRKSPGKRRGKIAIAPKAIVPGPNPGQDSEFYVIEQTLTKIGLNRLPSEALQDWIHRLENHLQPSLFSSLQDIIKLHYRYRFDPCALATTDRDQLKTLSQIWLQNYSQVNQPVSGKF
jgi:protein-glutamine gamma-glutamyltransferase